MRHTLAGSAPLFNVDVSGKVPRGSDPGTALRNHPAIRELVDRLTLPSLERWSPTRARYGLFLTFIEHQERLGRRAGRKPLPVHPAPPLPEPVRFGARSWIRRLPEYSAVELATYERAVLKDPAYGPDRRDFYRWLNRFEEDWPAPFTFTPPRYGGADGEPIAWGGRKKRLYGADRPALLKRAFAAVQAAHPSWKARSVWNELAMVVSELSGRSLTGAQLADLARPPRFPQRP
jgi:hypothetical protein